MQYKGQIIIPFASTTPVSFDPPKKMLCWDADDEKDTDFEPVIREVYYYNPFLKIGAVFSGGDGAFRRSGVVNDFCAEIPEVESDIASNRELSRWLSSNHGEVKIVHWNSNGTNQRVIVGTHWQYHPDETDKPVAYGERITKGITCLGVREWNGNEWVAPTKEFINKCYNSVTQNVSVSTDGDIQHFIILQWEYRKIAIGPINDMNKAIHYLEAVTDWKESHPIWNIKAVYPAIEHTHADTVLSDNATICKRFGYDFPKLLE